MANVAKINFKERTNKLGMKAVYAVKKTNEWASSDMVNRDGGKYSVFYGGCSCSNLESCLAWNTEKFRWPTLL